MAEPLIMLNLLLTIGSIITLKNVIEILTKKIIDTDNELRNINHELQITKQKLLECNRI